MEEDLVTKWAIRIAEFATERKFAGKSWTPSSVVVETTVSFDRERGTHSLYNAALVGVLYGETCYTMEEAFESLYKTIDDRTPKSPDALLTNE